MNDNPVVTVGETNTQSLYFEGDDSFTVFNDSELQSLTDFAILWAKFDENDRWDGLVGKGYLENKTGLIIRKLMIIIKLEFPSLILQITLLIF